MFSPMLKVLLQVALRNLALHRLKTAIVGGILAFGAFLVVFGLTLTDNIERSMAHSVVGSVAGHLQLYSDEAKDELALFGGSFMGREENGLIPRFRDLRDVALKSGNVADVVPMGFDMGLVARGNELDELFESLRQARKAGDQVALEQHVASVQQALAVVKNDLKEEAKIASNTEEIATQIKAVEATEAPAFWTTDLATKPEETFTYLESRIAPLSDQKQLLYFRYLGTDIDQFRRVFTKFKMVAGEPVPTGRRGILISHKTSEDFLKNLAARGFDLIQKRREKQNQTIKGDVELQTAATDMPKQYLQIMVHLDKQESKDVEAAARAFLTAQKESDEGDLQALVKKVLTVNDDTFAARREFFYKEIAPRIRMYEVMPGETMTLRAYTRSGYLRSVPVKVYGTYTFEGLEDSDLAGSFSIIDLASFRDLYGQMSAAALEELAEIKKTVKLKEVQAGENIEDSLFGASAGAVEVQGAVQEAQPQAASLNLQVQKASDAPFTQQDIEDGLVINAAVMLKDPTKADQTQAELKQLFKDAGAKIRVVDWQAASGTVGQFVIIVRAVLLFAVTIILIVALAIINNSMIMATIERIREIGTMRAIGAQRSFVLRMFLVETVTVGVLATATGAALATGLLFFLGAKGLPAPSDFVVFLFSGPKLYPQVEWLWTFLGPIVVVILATVFTMYPALLASRVAPANAMQEKE